MLEQVAHAFFEQRQILFGVRFVERATGDHLGSAAVHLERAHRGDEDDGIRHQARVAALDVHEFFHADVCAKAGFRDDVIGELQRDLIGDDGRVAVRDVRERTRVNERGRAFESLHQVRHDRVFHQDGHRAGDAQIFGGNRFAANARADHDAAQARADIFDAGRQAEDRHDF